MTQKELIRRIEQLESEVEKLQKQVATIRSSTKETSYRDYFGMFRGDKQFLAAVEAGARYRRSFHPDAKNKRATEKWIKSYMAMFKD